MKHLVSTLAIGLALAGCDAVIPAQDPNSAVSNEAPKVDAGVTQEVIERSNVQLSGLVTDDDANTLVNWTQTSGPLVTLDFTDIINPRFQAPAVEADQMISFRLSVNDGTNSAVFDDVEIMVKKRSASSQGVTPTTEFRRDTVVRYRTDKRRKVGGREVRNIDGYLNNVTHPTWGAAFSHLKRMGEADYSDLTSSMAGNNRPSARLVSNNILAQGPSEIIPNSFGYSDFVWQWGQFLDHDIGITEGAAEQADIAVPAGDPWFDPQNTGTAVIHFNRARFDTTTGTNASDPREQENEITAWIDGSMVYGSDNDRALALRVGYGSPYMATSNGNLLPYNTSGQTNANALGAAEDSLFLAGDVRVNEQIGLSVMHTLFVREHNRWAAVLEADNPGMSGEEIFEATKRLVVAEIQKITYDEFLPTLIGAGAIPGYPGYDETMSPGLFNEFSGAAYRFGHSMVNEQLLRLDSQNTTVPAGNVSLMTAFFTAPLYLTDSDSLDPFLRGLANQPHQKLDPKINSALRNMLFGPPGSGGLDLAALNIQRGRDHGLPCYNDMLDVMGLPRVTQFSDITSDVALQTALANTYANVDDIDLWVGGLAEDPVAGAQLGPLFQSMTIMQFEALRNGDRFWYEIYLTPEELALIDGRTLADIIRDNSGVGAELQDNVFVVP